MYTEEFLKLSKVDQNNWAHLTLGFSIKKYIKIVYSVTSIIPNN